MYAIALFTVPNSFPRALVDCRQWAVITHPETISPFDQASFLNYTATLQLRPVTVGRHTYVEWKGSGLSNSNCDSACLITSCVTPIKSLGCVSCICYGLCGMVLCRLRYCTGC